MDKDFESGDTNPFGLFLISMARWKKKFLERYSSYRTMDIFKNFLPHLMFLFHSFLNNYIF